MADRVTATMAAMPQLTTAATPQRTTTTATPLRITADTGRATTLPPTMVPATGALFAPHMPTARGSIAGMVIAGNARRDAKVWTTKGRRDVCGLFRARG